MATTGVSADEVCGAVGKALGAWSMVELMMGLLFTTVSEMPGSRGSVLFSSIISFEVRLVILDRMLRLENTLLSELDLAIWQRLVARLTKFYKKRHELAHFSIRWKGKDAMIQPFSTLENLNSRDMKMVSVENINQRRTEFGELSMILTYFLARYIPGPQSEFLLRTIPANPTFVRLAASATQILEARKRQPPPSVGDGEEG